MSEKKESAPIEAKPTSGILSETEKKKDLESRLSDTLRKLGSRMTRKEIRELASRIEVSKGLEWLKSELEKGESVFENLSEETLTEVLALIKEIKEAAESGLKELKIELTKINPTIDWEADKSMHFSDRFEFVKKLEQSELGKNIILDLEWFAIGALDSGVAILKMIMELIKDIFKLPKHVYEHYKTK